MRILYSRALHFVIRMSHLDLHGRTFVGLTLTHRCGALSQVYLARSAVSDRCRRVSPAGCAGKGSAGEHHYNFTLCYNGCHLISWGRHTVCGQVFTPPLVNIVNELVVGFQDWYIPQHSLRHDAQGVHRMQDTLLMRATLRGTPSAVPAHLRRTPRTEGYAPGPGADSPTSASRLNDGADEGDGSGRREVPKQLLHLMQLQVRFPALPTAVGQPLITLHHTCPCQHVRLFPDRRIDELEDCGITDLAVHAEEAGTGIVSQLQQMNQHPVVEQGRPRCGMFGVCGARQEKSVRR